jgi:hypothetical protein
MEYADLGVPGFARPPPWRSGRFRLHQPILHNAATDGGTWVECAVTLEQVTARCRPPIEGGALALWEAAAGMAEAHYRKASQQD